MDIKEKEVSDIEIPKLAQGAVIDNVPCLASRGDYTPEYGFGRPTKPIEEFISQEQAEQYLKEWQHRLYLDNWIIIIEFANYKDMPEVGSMGWSNMQVINQTSIITLCNKDGCDNAMMKFCQELALVHELLHCRYDWLASETYTEKYVDTLEHQNLEMMARSLIMAKYGIEREWFCN
jgi:hypothetical protein